MVDVYSTLKNRAASGKFVLAELHAQINTLWVDGDLTDAQRAELLALAEANQSADYTGLSAAEQALANQIKTQEQVIEELIFTIIPEIWGGGVT